MVVPSPTHKGVTAVAAADDIVAVTAGQNVVAAIAVQPDPVGRTRRIEHIVARAAVGPFDGRSSKVEANAVRTLNNNPVGTVAALHADIVGIHIQNIVARAAVKTVNTTVAVQPIITVATDQHIFFRCAADAIIAGGSYS